MFSTPGFRLVIEDKQVIDFRVQRTGNIMGKPERGIILSLLEKDNCLSSNADFFREIILGEDPKRVRYSFILVCTGMHLQKMLFNIPFPEEICLIDRRGKCKDEDGCDECILYTEIEYTKIIQPEKTEHEEIGRSAMHRTTHMLQSFSIAHQILDHRHISGDGRYR